MDSETGKWLWHCGTALHSLAIQTPLTSVAVIFEEFHFNFISSLLSLKILDGIQFPSIIFSLLDLESLASKYTICSSSFDCRLPKPNQVHSIAFDVAHL
jgi:hypothetical protein